MNLACALTASFDRHGIQTVHAADGAQAILISQPELPDLLVLDLGLPEVDGFAVVRSSDFEQRVMGLSGRLTSATGRENADELEAHPVRR